jgi:hypothetical protein
LRIGGADDWRVVLAEDRDLRRFEQPVARPPAGRTEPAGLECVDDAQRLVGAVADVQVADGRVTLDDRTPTRRMTLAGGRLLPWS